MSEDFKHADNVYLVYNYKTRECRLVTFFEVTKLVHLFSDWVSYGVVSEVLRNVTPE